MCQICTELDLNVGDVIEVDTIEHPFVKEFYPLMESGTLGVIVLNDAYFEHLPDMQSGDPTHKCIVWAFNKGRVQEPGNVLPLHKRFMTWRKKRKVSPVLK